MVMTDPLFWRLFGHRRTVRPGLLREADAPARTGCALVLAASAAATPLPSATVAAGSG